MDFRNLVETVFYALGSIIIIFIMYLELNSNKQHNQNQNINNKIVQANKESYKKICLDNIVYINYFKGIAPYVDPKTKSFVNCNNLKKIKIKGENNENYR